MAIDPLYYTNMGFKRACVWSGQVAPSLSSAPGAVAVGSDVMFQSGTGRLNGIILHQAVFVLSGVAGAIYDAHAPVSGGPIPASGHVLLTNTLLAANATSVVGSGTQTVAGQLIRLDIPFTSGLCYNSRSGQTGVTFVWSPEPSAANI